MTLLQIGVGITAGIALSVFALAWAGRVDRRESDFWSTYDD